MAVTLKTGGTVLRTTRVWDGQAFAYAATVRFENPDPPPPEVEIGLTSLAREFWDDLRGAGRAKESVDISADWSASPDPGGSVTGVTAHHNV